MKYHVTLESSKFETLYLSLEKIAITYDTVHSTSLNCGLSKDNVYKRLLGTSTIILFNSKLYQNEKNLYYNWQ